MSDAKDPAERASRRMLWVWLAVAAAFVALVLIIGIPLMIGK
jgi:hypothetical protein